MSRSGLPIGDAAATLSLKMDPGLRGRAIRRAMGLAALISRGHMEPAAADPQILQMHDLVVLWTRETGALYELDPHEARILQEPLGRLLPIEIGTALFRAEQLTVLAWALGRGPRVRHDEHVFDQDLAARVAFLRKDAIERLLAAQAEPMDAIVLM